MRSPPDRGQPMPKGHLEGAGAVPLSGWPRLRVPVMRVLLGASGPSPPPPAPAAASGWLAAGLREPPPRCFPKAESSVRLTAFSSSQGIGGGLPLGTGETTPVRSAAPRPPAVALADHYFGLHAAGGSPCCTRSAPTASSRAGRSGACSACARAAGTRSVLVWPPPVASAGARPRRSGSLPKCRLQ